MIWSSRDLLRCKYCTLSSLLAIIVSLFQISATIESTRKLLLLQEKREKEKHLYFDLIINPWLLKIFQLYYNLLHISTNQKSQKVTGNAWKRAKTPSIKHFKNKKKEKKEGKEDRCRKEQVNSSNKEIRPPLLFRHHKEVSTTAKMMQK